MLSKNQEIILKALALRGYKNTKDIADQTGLCFDSVRQSLHYLEKKGYIKVGWSKVKDFSRITILK